MLWVISYQVLHDCVYNAELHIPLLQLLLHSQGCYPSQLQKQSLAHSAFLGCLIVAHLIHTEQSQGTKMCSPTLQDFNNLLQFSGSVTIFRICYNFVVLKSFRAGCYPFRSGSESIMVILFIISYHFWIF